MTTLAEKINRLIRLSASSNLNEARNAAYQACRLLRENGIFLKERVTHKESKDEKGAPKVNMHIRMIYVESQEQAQAINDDHIRAGFKYNANASVNEIIKSNHQVIVLERGDRQVHIRLK